ncbi:MAG: hypothetical protein LRY53_11320 [Burkholderiaceae bacterium]|nr:hypothetical protein [Burkholderiaceae bacterium]MCD8516177.1 hypothetical protein [Burkholderiaceae bacterium]MCD8536708.1 hypothetical protein [Burkholderiaceae bacterium]MCD8566185.1 hypothetical protein [Burkholderiaceae bacterium]
MKKFLLASGVTLATMAAGLGTAHAVNVSTSEMVTICQDTGNAAAQNFCNGYAQGVYDMYVSDIHPTKNPPYVCFPNPGPSRADAIKGYVAWASKATEYSRLPAADTMMRYLATTYPCKK